jgi:uronate dehydrogenase
MTFDRVLLTGAAGSIGSCIRPALRASTKLLRICDVAPLAAQDGEEVLVGDLQDPDVARRAVAGMDAVVHLAAVPDEAAFEVLAGPNLHGAFNVIEQARRAGVRRIVYASSNRITGFYPVSQRLSGAEPVRPDGLYGATKAFGEALGRLYAERFGLEVVCVRIGSFEPRPSEPRHLSTWLSPGDAVRLFAACLSAPEVTFAIVYGASANTRGWWDLGPTRALGYEPQDDAEAFAAEIGAAVTDGPQSGRYTEPGYGGWAATSTCPTAAPDR